MNLKEYNSLVDLFFHQAENQNPQEVFLEWLNAVNRKKYTWSQTIANIYKLTKILNSYAKEGDRILLVSENRPEWLIADLSIMLAKAITVPAYITYTEEDYDYLIEDCKPSIVIVSNNTMHKKLEKIINKKNFIQKVITFDNVVGVNYGQKYLDFATIIKNDLSKKDEVKNINLKRNSPACIIYTSGTGGNPKGVVLSHGGILNNIEGAIEFI